MKTSRTNLESRCPACLKTLDAATDPEAAANPKPGDLSVCCYCSVMLVFNTDMTSRLLRQTEFDELPADLRLRICAYRIVVSTVAQA